MKNTELLPTPYLSQGCSCYLAKDVEGFIEEGAEIWYDDGHHYVHKKQVDEQALIEYRKLQAVIANAKEPIKVRIRQGYKHHCTDKDWSGLQGQLFGSTTLVLVDFGNSKQFKEISHYNLILA